MKKKFIIAGIVGIVLIFIVLLLIVIISNSKPVVDGNVTPAIPTPTDTVTNNTTTENVVSNTVEGYKISGDIEDYELEDGNTIPLPPTFSYVKGDIDSGVVVEDENGNQFVWVPVNDFTTYSQRFVFEKNGGQDTEELAKNLEDISDYDASFDDSVRNYGGFYVARYEAGKDSKGIISQDGVLPITGVTWQQAKDQARGMYAENDAFQSDLINSYAWDYICLWIRDGDFNIDDSRSYGNYQNSVENLNAITECGSNRKWITNNICDMAGNVWELTTESQIYLIDGEYATIHIVRGGGSWNNGDEFPISSRMLSDSDGANLGVGYRVVLYLK